MDGKPPSASERALWTCPRCGAKLLTENLWHSCGYATLDDWYARMGPRGRRLFRRFEQLLGRCGEYHLAPAKTRIAFLAQVRFAGVTGVSEEGLACNFALPYPLKSRRFLKVEEVVPGWWSHRLHVTKLSEFDRELQSWLRRSYRLMGMRGRLKRSAGRTPARRSK